MVNISLSEREDSGSSPDKTAKIVEDMKVDNENVYENKCCECNNWSVSKGYMTLDRCGDGKERWFDNYYCENCGGECSVAEDDDWNRISNGDTINFKD